MIAGEFLNGYVRWVIGLFPQRLQAEGTAPLRPIELCQQALGGLAEMAQHHLPCHTGSFPLQSRLQFRHSVVTETWMTNDT
jgi:hypothetical protein